MLYYKCYDKFIIRIPIFNNREYLGLAEDNIRVFNEAIYISSRDVKEEMQKRPSSDYSKSLKKTLNNFLIRMSTRCTPFGIFAGTGVGMLSDRTDIYIDNNLNLNAVCSINFVVLDEILNELNEINEIKLSQKYFINTTLYLFGDKYRYVEKCKIERGYSYEIVEILRTDYLDTIIEISSSNDGITIGKIVETLTNEEYIDNKEEGFLFAVELIKSQILVAEMALSITKENFLIDLIKKLDDLEDSRIKQLRNLLLDIETSICGINQLKVGMRIGLMQRFEDTLKKKLKTNLNQTERPLKTNLYFNFNRCTLDKSITHNLKGAIEALIKLTVIPESHHLIEFKQKFLKRYEYEEIPLLEALDPDIGIGFAFYSAESVLEDNLTSNIDYCNEPRSPGNKFSVSVNPIIYAKFQEYLENGNEIIINDHDLNELDPINYDMIPDTLCIGTEIFSDSTSPQLYVKFAGGASPTSLLGRFSKENLEIKEFLQEIIDIEEKFLGNEEVFAEISYLPERANNAILLERPLLHKYEIPILNGPSEYNDSVIHLSDIYVSINSDSEIIIRSKRLGKRIIPRNTSAHQFDSATNPLYFFLSLLQVPEQTKLKLTLDLGNLIYIKNHLPRISFKGIVVLSLEQWRLVKNDIKIDNDFRANFLKIKALRGIPDKVWFIDLAGSRILLDFNRPDSIELLKHQLYRDEAILEEYLHTESSPSVVKSNNGHRNNEIIFTYIKDIEH